VITIPWVGGAETPSRCNDVSGGSVMTMHALSPAPGPTHSASSADDSRSHAARAASCPMGAQARADLAAHVICYITSGYTLPVHNPSRHVRTSRW
jgi:hypothetical protein